MPKMNRLAVQARTEYITTPPLVQSGALELGHALGDDALRPDALSGLLEQPESARIALYIPEEWLPAAGQHRYSEAYVNAWWSTLAHVDARADFVDGDMGEQDNDELPPLVAKAAHLAPMLAKVGLITASDVAYIVGGTNSAVLCESFADTRRAPVPARQPLLSDLPSLQRQVQIAASDPAISTARAAWLQESGNEAMVREIARGLDVRTAERLMTTDSATETQIALSALARHGRKGTAIGTQLPWMLQQRQHADAAVRQQAAVSLRHLHHGGRLDLKTLELIGVEQPQLAGDFSHNMQFMQGEVLQARLAAERIAHDVTLASSLYPVVMVGGSRLKGYRGETADVDRCVVVRPGMEVADDALRPLFGGEVPKILQMTQTPGGLHIDPFWSNFLYNSAWIGEIEAVAALRRASAHMYTSPADRHVALRRLEQDTLQYRLLHKGYQRHYPVRADDELIAVDGIDSRSTFWDSGYRKLATRLFAEKVRLPKIK